MHTAGLGELVAASLTADLNGGVAYADDSAVMISAKAPAGKVGRLSYVKNSFAVIGSVPRRHDLNQSIEMITHRLNGWHLTRTRRPFRLMFSVDGQLVGVPRGARSRLEMSVSGATGGRPMPRGGGDEYWTITRRDLDEVLFCRRIPGLRRHRPPRGGLAPDVAEVIVNAVGPPRPSDVVLDPFAGSGALIAARVQQPFREAICSDLGYRDGSAQLTPGLARRAGVCRLADDARTLASVSDETVDVVVTDPPWGEFDRASSATVTVIIATLNSMYRVMRAGGRIAMLVARRLVPAVTTQWDHGGFRVDRSYDVLVNGHPATLLVGVLGQADRPQAR